MNRQALLRRKIEAIRLRNHRAEMRRWALCWRIELLGITAARTESLAALRFGMARRFVQLACHARDRKAVLKLHTAA